MVRTKEVNWTLALYMSFFLGFLGIDRFIMGKVFTGILKLITFGGFGIWYLVDLIRIMASSKFGNIDWQYPKNKTLHIIIIIVIFVLMIISNSQSNVTETSTQPTSSEVKTDTAPVVTEKPVEKIVKTTYSMNEDIDVDYLSYNINKVETFTEMGTSMMNKETNGKFVKVYFEITNNAKETKQIFSPRFKIEDNQGRKYDRLSDDILYISDSLELGQQLQPGLGADGAVVFEMPEDSTSLVLIISGDWISIKEVKVKLSTPTDVGKDMTKQNELDEMMAGIMG